MRCASDHKNHPRQTVKHNIRELESDMVHLNGTESYRAMPKRSCEGANHFLRFKSHWPEAHLATWGDVITFRRGV